MTELASIRGNDRIKLRVIHFFSFEKIVFLLVMNTFCKFFTRLQFMIKPNFPISS